MERWNHRLQRREVPNPALTKHPIKAQVQTYMRLTDELSNGAPETDLKEQPDSQEDELLPGVTVRPAEDFYAQEDPEDGIYKSVDEAEYHKLDRVSQSVLKQMDTSPAHAKAQQDGEYTASRSQKFGTAMHRLLLEPEIFEEEYGEAGQCAGRKGDGDRCQYGGKNRITITDLDAAKEAEAVAIDRPGNHHFCKTHTPDTDAVEWAEEAEALEQLSSSDQEKLERMEAQVIEHPTASKLLRDLDGLAELTILWTDDATGLRCKCRIDRLVDVPRLGLVSVDYKTTRNVAPGTHYGAFGRDAATYGYHKQAGFYLEGAAAEGAYAEHFIIIAQEKTPPYDVVPYLFSHEDIEAGMADLLAAMRQYADCQKRGSWPGISSSIVELELPDWIYR